MSENQVQKDMVVEAKAKVITLSKPVVWEDETISKLTLDFDQLSGDDILMIESDFMDFVTGMKNVYLNLKNDHPGYHAVLAAKAAGVHPNLMKKLAATDFLKATGAAKAFLRNMG